MCTLEKVSIQLFSQFFVNKIKEMQKSVVFSCQSEICISPTSSLPNMSAINLNNDELYVLDKKGNFYIVKNISLIFLHLFFRL